MIQLGYGYAAVAINVQHCLYNSIPAMVPVPLVAGYVSFTEELSRELTTINIFMVDRARISGGPHEDRDIVELDTIRFRAQPGPAKSRGTGKDTCCHTVVSDGRISRAHCQ